MLHPNLSQNPPPLMEWSDDLNAWKIHSYQLVLSILSDPRFAVVGASNQNENLSIPSDPLELASSNPIIIDAFQQELPWVRNKIQTAIDTHCISVLTKPNIDFYYDIILPCCQQLAIELTDGSITNEEAPLLLNAAHELFLMNDTNEPQKAHEAVSFLTNFFLDRLHHLSPQRKTDFINTLTQADIAPTMLIAPLVQLFTGLATSLPLLISNVMLALFTNEEAQKQYLNSPTQGINELLRYAGPAQYVYRMALEDGSINDYTFKRGDRLALYLISANMDSKQFECPHQLQLKRAAVAHVSLGYGIHACLGAPLIRAALQIIPENILKHFPNTQLDINSIQWGGSKAIQGVTKMIRSKELV